MVVHTFSLRTWKLKTSQNYVVRLVYFLFYFILLKGNEIVSI